MAVDSRRSLVVVESPAKARTLGRFLGKGYEVKASMGHVRDLPERELGVKIDDGGFQPEYVILKNKRSVIKELKEGSQKAKAIYLATDPDREGEAISWHLVKAMGWKNLPIHRVVFHEITQDAIEKAFLHPREIDMRLVNAQQARRILDRLVGYQLSPLLWRKVQRGLSAGRVQSAALKLVVDREREVRAFHSTEYWVIEATLRRYREEKGRSFEAVLRGVRGQRSKLHVDNDAQAQAILGDLKDAGYKVAQVTKKEVHYRPAPPFITSTLQQEAWRKLRFPAKKTMLLAQQLYEGLPLGAEGSVGLITYMRTDSTHVAPTALREAQAYIRERFGEAYTPLTPRMYTRKVKGAQEAHEAIRPTSIHREPEKIKKYLASEQWKLYDLIWKRMVASQMVDAVYDATQVEAEAAGSTSKVYLFQARGAVVKFPGFRALYSEGRDDEEEEGRRPLPEVKKGDSLDCLKLDSEQKFTQPPPRYTEATLIKALEEKGIGRPSTYAAIISTILDRTYVTKEQGRFKPSQLGEVVNDQLVGHFPNILDLDFTAQMEERLDDIARGEREWVPVLQEFYQPFRQALDVAFKEMPRVKVEEPSEEICSKCGRPMVVKVGRFGRFLSCSGFPECRNSKPLIQKTGVECPRCGGDLVQRRGKGRTFFGCSNYPTCNFSVSRQPLTEPCPQCGGLLVAYGKEGGQCTKCTFKGGLPEREPVEASA